MIAVIDYDAGNIRSIQNALCRIDEQAFLTSDPEAAEKADIALLPGVGSFGVAVQKLEKSGLAQALKARFAADKPTLGICLGMQLMFEESEESPNASGLGFFRGKAEKIRGAGLKVPHVGWTDISAKQDVFRPFDNEFFYFVHSYAVLNTAADVVAAEADYGGKFVCAVKKGRTAACQFHPEKSGENGLRLLKTLIEAVKE